MSKTIKHNSTISCRYDSGWRPEATLKQTILNMVAIIFDETATIEECQMAANTLVEIVHPELFLNYITDVLKTPVNEKIKELIGKNAELHNENE